MMCAWCKRPFEPDADTDNRHEYGDAVLCSPGCAARIMHFDELHRDEDDD